MVLELLVTAVVGFVLGVLAAGFSTMAGLVLFALWLLGRTVPSGLVETGTDLVSLVVAPGNELLFVAAVLVGVGVAGED